MVGHAGLADTGLMRAFAEDLAIRAIDVLASPIALAAVGILFLAVFSGLAARMVLYVESLAAREQSR